MLSYGRRPKNLTYLVCKKNWRVYVRAPVESVLKKIYTYIDYWYW